MALSKLKLTLADVSEKPTHPQTKFQFPKREFGKKKIVQRSYQADWFITWPWLHYCSTDDVVFFIMAMKHKGMERSRGDYAFTHWKDATRDNQSSAVHKTALQSVVDIPASYPDVGEIVSTNHARDKKDSRQCLLKILSNVAFLA